MLPDKPWQFPGPSLRDRPGRWGPHGGGLGTTGSGVSPGARSDPERLDAETCGLLKDYPEFCFVRTGRLRHVEDEGEAITADAGGIPEEQLAEVAQHVTPHDGADVGELFAVCISPEPVSPGAKLKL